MRKITQEDFDREIQSHARLVLMSDQELAQDVLGRLAAFPTPRSSTINEAIQALLQVIPELTRD